MPAAEATQPSAELRNVRQREPDEREPDAFRPIADGHAVEQPVDPLKTEFMFQPPQTMAIVVHLPHDISPNFPRGPSLPFVLPSSSGDVTPAFGMPSQSGGRA
jgi:hypothetical protein